MKTIFKVLFAFIFANYVSAPEPNCDVDPHEITFKTRVLEAPDACGSTAVTDLNDGFEKADVSGVGLMIGTMGRFALAGSPLAPFSWFVPVLINMISPAFTSSASNQLFEELFEMMMKCVDSKIEEERRRDLEIQWSEFTWSVNNFLLDATHENAGVREEAHRKLGDVVDDMNAAIQASSGYWSTKLLKDNYLQAEALLPVSKVAAEILWASATTNLQMFMQEGKSSDYNLVVDDIRDSLTVLKTWCEDATNIIETMYTVDVWSKYWQQNYGMDKYFEWNIKWEEGENWDKGDCYRTAKEEGKEDAFKQRIENESKEHIKSMRTEYKTYIDVLWRNSWLIGYYGEVSYHPVTQPGEWFGCDAIGSTIRDVSFSFIIQECSAMDECIGVQWSDVWKIAALKKDVNCLNGGMSTGKPYVSIWKSTSPLCYQKMMSGSYPGCRHDAPALARYCTEGSELELRALCDSESECIGFIWDSSKSYGCLRTAVGCTSYGMRKPTVYDYYAKCRDSSDYASNTISSHEIIVAQLRSNGQCLEANNNGLDIYVFSHECNDAVTQKWKYNLETKEIISMFDNKCLDVSKSTGEIQTWECNDDTNQKWLFDSKTKGLKVIWNKECVKPSDSAFATADCSDYDVLQWDLIPIIDTTERFTETVTTQCYDESGSKSASTDDALSSVTCRSDYQLVSCGTFGSNSGSIDGSFISGDTCFAQMGGGVKSEEYVMAVARCCRLHGTPSCSSYRSSKGHIVDGFCSNNEMLTGCTVDTSWKGIDGAFPRDDIIASDTDITDSFTGFSFPLLQRCTAKSGKWDSAYGVWANARCCGYDDDRYNLKCGTIKSTLKSGLDYTASVSCPSGWFLSGCSAYSDSTAATSWYIANDECIAKAKESSHVERDGVWAVAICCQESYDPSYQPHCYTASGDLSGSLDPDFSSATCGFGYQLVSCGTSGSTTGKIDGSWIDNGICKALMGASANIGENVRAKARCCKLQSSATCTSYRSDESGLSDDALVDAICQNDQVLSGCTVDSLVSTIDGAYPRDDTITYRWHISGTLSPFTLSSQRCTAQNAGRSSDRGVHSNAQCCSYGDNRYKLECGAIKSGMSGSDFTASVSCPSGWILTGCSGISPWRATTMWYTEGEKCIAKAWDGSNPDKGVWAVAICCQESWELESQIAVTSPVNDWNIFISIQISAICFISIFICVCAKHIIRLNKKQYSKYEAVTIDSECEE